MIIFFSFVSPKIKLYIIVKELKFSQRSVMLMSQDSVLFFFSLSFLQPKKDLSLLWDDRKFFSA